MEVVYAISSRTSLNPKLSCSLHNCTCRYVNFIWVSERLKLIYFETPKCGCTSIKKALDLSRSPLHFATAYLIQSQRHCSDPNNTSAPLIPMCPDFGASVDPDALRHACFLAAANLSEGKCWSDPVGKFAFMHFFGTAEQAVELFPDYRKFIVLRSPFERLTSARNMFYNFSDLPREMRLLQCKDALQERNSLRFFIENSPACPNHHFDRIVNFVSRDVLTAGTELVSFRHLGSYWEGLAREYDLPPLANLNAARSYLDADVSESEILRDERYSAYYREDYELMKLAR